MPAGGLGPADKNLAYRAAVAYQEATGWPTGFAIEIDKRIPVGGGLGRRQRGRRRGAARVGRAVPESAWGRGSSSSRRRSAPTCRSWRSRARWRWRWGRGERLLPVRALDARPVLLAVPDFAVATADAYAWLSERSRDLRACRRASSRPESLATWESLSLVAANDFETVVASRHPVIGQARGRALMPHGSDDRDDERVGVDGHWGLRRTDRIPPRSAPSTG